MNTAINLTADERFKALDNLIAAIEGAGLILKDGLNLDGTIQRVPTTDKPKSLNGWYVGFEDTLVATFGDHRTGEKHTHSSVGELTKEQRAELNRKRQEALYQRQIEQRQQHEGAAHKAKLLLTAAKVCESHPYLTKKHVLPIGSMRVGRWDYGSDNADVLLIPLYDLPVSGGLHLWSIQAIFANDLAPSYGGGNKRMLKGGRKKGLCYPIGLGQWDGVGALYICEGVSTALTVYQLNGNQPTLAAIDAGNLKDVAIAARKRYPLADIIISADNDHANQINTGLIKGNEAAIAIKASVNYPEFTDEEKKQWLSDWNDWAIARGLL